MSDLEVRASMAADPEAVYALISDITRMGEWSPENTGGKWLGGADGPRLGARFKGSNRNGWRRWSSVCTVTSAEPGRRFAFSVRYGPIPIADWGYTIEATTGGCVVTEEWTDHRPGFMRVISPALVGVKDRVEANRANMATTLQRIKTAAEATRR